MAPAVVFGLGMALGVLLMCGLLGLYLLLQMLKTVEKCLEEPGE